MNASRSIIGPIVRDIGVAPRLTAEEERELASRRPPRPPGSDREARAAWKADPAAQAAWRAWQACDARRTLILSITPMALKLAAGRAGRTFGEDAFGQALLIAIKAVDNFEPARGWRLTTYVARCVLTALPRDLIATGFAIHLPDYLRTLALEPPVEGEHRYATDARLAVHVPALSQLGDEDGDYNPAAPGDDDGRPGFDELGRLREAIGRLEPRLARIVRARHLPGPGEAPATLQAIGKELGLTKERARQLLAEAMTRLREDLESPSGPPPVPPGPNLSPAQRDALAGLLAGRPGEPAARIAEAFQAETGRPVDVRTVYAHRRRFREAAGHERSDRHCHP